MVPYPVSLAPEVVTTWDEFCHRYLTRRSRDAETLRTVIEADPGFAVGRAMAALLAAVGGDPDFDAAGELAAAREGRAEHDWERSFVAAAGTTVGRGLWVSYDAWSRHAELFPADLLGFEMAAFLLVMSTDPDLHERALALAQQTSDAVGEHVAVVGFQAMCAQEVGRLDEAHRLAVRALELDPPGPSGAHPMAHVYFEGGDHATGLGFLDAWLPTTDQAAPFRTHLVWHAALHELELGRGDAALGRYHACTARGGPGGLFDGSSLLWRCQLLGHAAPGEDPGETRVSELVAPLLDAVPFTFVGAHVALGLATAGDADTLRRFGANAAGFTAPGAAELLPDLALGFAAFVEDDHATAGELLWRRAGDFVRLGGSHAQREVFEDTLIHTLVRGGRPEDASTLIRRRLDRRPSAIDSALLARTGSGAVPR